MSDHSLAEKFAAMKAYCDKLTMAPFQRERLKGQLEYFRVQALCDVDRKDHPRVIAQNFKALLQTKKAPGVINGFRAKPDFWREVASFVGDFDYSIRRREDVNRTDLSVHQFFQCLKEKVTHLPESRRLVKLVMRFAIGILILESRKPFAERNQTEIQYIWKVIWPLLNELGMLRQFQCQVQLREKVKTFIAGDPSNGS